MEHPRIYLSPPHLGGEELSHIQSAVEQNWIAPMGKNLDDFETSLCNFTQSPHCLALNSGTSAIHLALRLAGVGKGDTVICPSFTFVATVNPIFYQAAHPILIDSEADTWNICPDLLEKALSDLKKKNIRPKALIVVHLYGMMAKMPEIVALANHFEVPIIEDAAEALGSYYDEKAAGTWGDYGVLSFNGNKIITTSAGGALLLQKQADREKALFWATQAKDPSPHYQHSELGYNYRLSNLLAGVGLGQMAVLEQRIAQRRKNFEFYKQAFQGTSLQLIEELPNTFSNRWLSCVLTENFEQREKIRLALAKENIESRPLWKPLHLQPLFEQYPSPYISGVSEALFERGLCLPSGSSLSLHDLTSITDVVTSSYA